MPNIFRTTGLVPLIIWAAFFLIGLINDRPVICVISAIFFAIGFYRRVKIIKRKDPMDVLWKGYVTEHPEMKDYPYEIWRFSSSDDEQLCEKIQNGLVKSQSFLVDYFEANNKPLPSVGQINILCCGDKVIGVCRTSEVIRTNFGQVDRELATTEGFTSVSKWREAKKKIFGIQCERMGINFSDNLQILFEEFEIVYTLEDVT